MEHVDGCGVRVAGGRHRGEPPVVPLRSPGRLSPGVTGAGAAAGDEQQDGGEQRKKQLLHDADLRQGALGLRTARAAGFGPHLLLAGTVPHHHQHEDQVGEQVGDGGGDGGAHRAEGWDQGQVESQGGQQPDAHRQRVQARAPGAVEVRRGQPRGRLRDQSGDDDHRRQHGGLVVRPVEQRQHEVRRGAERHRAGHVAEERARQQPVQSGRGPGALPAGHPGVDHPGDRQPGQPQQLGVLRRDRVDAHHAGAGHEAQEREVEAQVQQRHQPAELAAHAVLADADGQGKAGPPTAVDDPAPGQPAPGLRGHRQVGHRERDQDEQRAVHPERPADEVRREERDLLRGDHQVRAADVLHALQARLADGHQQLGEHGQPRQRHQPHRDGVEEQPLQQRGAGRPQHGTEHASGKHDQRGGRPQPGMVAGVPGEEERRRAGQSGGGHHRDHAGEHPEQCVDADVGRGAGACHQDGGHAERHQRGQPGDHVRRNLRPGPLQQAQPGPPDAHDRLPHRSSAAATPSSAQRWRKCRVS